MWTNRTLLLFTVKEKKRQLRFVKVGLDSQWFPGQSGISLGRTRQIGQFDWSQWSLPFPLPQAQVHPTITSCLVSPSNQTALDVTISEQTNGPSSPSIRSFDHFPPPSLSAHDTLKGTQTHLYETQKSFDFPYCTTHMQNNSNKRTLTAVYLLCLFVIGWAEGWSLTHTNTH